MSWRSSCVESLLLLTLGAGSLVACRPAPGRGATLQVVTVAPDADADVWVDGSAPTIRVEAELLEDP